MIRDHRGKIPIYVVVDDPEGNAVLLNQYTGQSVLIGPRPYAVSDLRDRLAEMIGKGPRP